MKSPLQSATKTKLKLREILLMGLFGATLIVVQVALAVLPNIELVSLLVIVYTVALGSKVFFPIGVFVLAEGLIYGFGLWFINYLYIWAILAVVVLLLRKIGNTVVWVIVSGVFGLMFGSLCAIPYLFMGGIGAAVAYWVNGIIFDLMHCGGNLLVGALLMKPCLTVMKKLYAGSAPETQTAE